VPERLAEVERRDLVAIEQVRVDGEGEARRVMAERPGQRDDVRPARSPLTTRESDPSH
jgi:hypothetical protein